MKKLKVFGLAVAVFALTACDNPHDISEKNFKRVAQLAMDQHGAGYCVNIPARNVPFTMDNSPLTAMQKHVVDMMATEGLLATASVQAPSYPGSKNIVASTEYRLTDYGKKSYREPSNFPLPMTPTFCTGKMQVEKILEMSEPKEMYGTKVVKVQMKYSIKDADKWALSEPMVKLHKSLQIEQAKNGVGTLTLVLDKEKGWVFHKDYTPAKK